MKIAFFGTPDFAGTILTGILKFPEIDCRLVVSQPDKPVGRKKELLHTAVKQRALDNNIEVLQPSTLRIPRDTGEAKTAGVAPHQILIDLDLDFIVVVAYGRIIPNEILEIPRYGCINLHGSILPAFRGASPVQAAVKSGLRETGLTTMYMSEGMDEGDVLEIQKIVIGKDDTSLDVFRKMSDIGPSLLKNTLEKIIAGDLVGSPQDNTLASYCSKISREDGEVSFLDQTAQEIYNTYRAYTPWPGIYTSFEGKRLVLEQVQLFEEDSDIHGVPGCCIKLSKNRYAIIAADRSILEILRVKLEGKKSMDTVNFVNGNREILGYIFP